METKSEEKQATVKKKLTVWAQKAAEAAKKASGWKKWVLVALAVILAGLAVFTQTQCSRVTPGQVQQAHGVYHVLTGTECILVLPVEESKK